VICTELADDDGTIPLPPDRSLVAELGRRLGVPRGERRLLERHLGQLLELELFVLEDDARTLRVAHWEELQGLEAAEARRQERAAKRPRPAHEAPATSSPSGNEAITIGSLSNHFPTTIGSLSAHEDGAKSPESHEAGSQKRREEKRLEEKRVEEDTRADARDPTPSGPSMASVDLMRSARAWIVAFVRAVGRATGTEPHMAHRHGAVLDLLRRYGADDLHRELVAYEAWLSTRRKPPADPWLRFCDRVGRWSSEAAAPVDWEAEERRLEAMPGGLA
jgi:hypothetical protein